MLKFLRMLKGQKGFTLIELVFVVIILAVLAGIALLSLGSTEEDAKAAAVKADFRALATAIKVFRVKEGSYPASLADLITSGTHYQPMLDEIPADPYGTAYGYTDNTTSALISSAGGDSMTVR